MYSGFMESTLCLIGTHWANAKQTSPRRKHFVSREHNAPLQTAFQHHGKKDEHDTQEGSQRTPLTLGGTAGDP
jgi:hypothetical protein